MKTKLLTTAVLAFSVSAGAQASLVARDGGMVYDTVNDITWAADANLFATQAASNPNLVNEIITGNGGVINDTPNYYDDGTYILSPADFNTGDGTMSWWGAQAWANNLTLGGYTDWALPTTVPALPDYNQTGSQMGDLFYTQLAGVAESSLAATHNADYDLFSNMQSYPNWSGSEDANPDLAWGFDTTSGQQLIFFKDYQFYAMAVRPGDVAASSVPVPAAAWLFGSGLIGLASFTRIKNKSANLIAA